MYVWTNIQYIWCIIVCKCICKPMWSSLWWWYNTKKKRRKKNRATLNCYRFCCYVLLLFLFLLLFSLLLCNTYFNTVKRLDKLVAVIKNKIKKKKNNKFAKTNFILIKCAPTFHLKQTLVKFNATLDRQIRLAAILFK